MDFLRNIVFAILLMVTGWVGLYLSRPKCESCGRGRLGSIGDADGVKFYRCDNCGKREWKVG